MDGSKAKVLGVGSLGWPGPIRLVLCEILHVVTERGQHKDRKRYKVPGFKDRGRGPKPRNAEAAGKGRIECGRAETL